MSTLYFAHPTAIIDEGAVIGTGTKIRQFCHIMPNPDFFLYFYVTNLTIPGKSSFAQISILE